MTGNNHHLTADHQPPDWLRWLDLVPIAWLLAVITAYAFLALEPLVPPWRREAAGVLEVERRLPLLLLALVAAAIIRYLFGRQAGSPAGSTDAAAPSGEGRDSV